MEYEITFDQLETMEHPNVIDIRTPEQYAYGTYPGAVNIPTEDIKPESGKPIYLLCQSGVKSLELAETWQEQGFPGGQRSGRLSGIPAPHAG